MYHSPSIGMPCGPSMLYEKVRSRSGLSNRSSSSSPSIRLPESENLGHYHAVAGGRPEADLLALDRVAGDGILAGEGQDNSSLVIAHNLPELRVKQVFGGWG